MFLTKKGVNRLTKVNHIVLNARRNITKRLIPSKKVNLKKYRYNGQWTIKLFYQPTNIDNWLRIMVVDGNYQTPDNQWVYAGYANICGFERSVGRCVLNIKSSCYIILATLFKLYTDYNNADTWVMQQTSVLKLDKLVDGDDIIMNQSQLDDIENGLEPKPNCNFSRVVIGHVLFIPSDGDINTSNYIPASMNITQFWQNEKIYDYIYNLG